MNKAQFLLLLKAWADTRNLELMALIEDILENLFEKENYTKDFLSAEFREIVEDMIRNRTDKAEKLGGREPLLVAGYDDEENVITIWQSIGQAAKATDGNQGKISNCVKDGTKHLKKKWIKVVTAPTTKLPL
jgi:hypothetical protein